MDRTPVQQSPSVALQVRRIVAFVAILIVANASFQLTVAALATWGQVGDFLGALVGILLTSGAPAGIAAWGLMHYQPWARTLALVLAVLWSLAGLGLGLFELVLAQSHVQRLGYPSPQASTIVLSAFVVIDGVALVVLLTRRSVRTAFSRAAA